MTTIISGSSPSITFSDSTTQTTAFTSTPSVTSITTSADASIHGLTVGLGAGSVSTNTAVGVSALVTNGAGLQNTAVGNVALTTNGAGSYNSAFGFGALNLNSSGSYNTAIGNTALVNNTASSNTAVGYQAGYNNQTGDRNTFLGYLSGNLQTSGFNTFVGARSGLNSTGERNTFVGAVSNIPSVANYGCGELMTTGTKNTILGGFNGNQGGLDIRTQSNYIVLSDGDGNPRLYMDGSGYLYSAPTYVNTTGGSANLRMTGSNGQFALSTSSLRYKKNIENAPYGLADVMAIRPVIYQSKSIIDGDKTFGGFIAEEIHDAGLTQFVDYDDEGRPNSLQYGNMVSLCVKAIQELNAKFDAYVASHP